MRPALLLFLLAGPVLAQPAPSRPPARLQVFISPMGQPFRVPEGEPYPVAAWFAATDSNGDGAISRAEFRTDALAFFKTLDTDTDGVIDGREIERYEQEIVPEVYGGSVGGGIGVSDAGVLGTGLAPIGGRAEDVPKAKPPRYGSLPTGAGRYGLLNIPEPVVGADADLNRRITAREFVAAADRRFGLLDPDETGQLTLATLPEPPLRKPRR